MKKLTLKYIQQYFEDHDCELYETEYINDRTKMRYRCKCGNKKCKIRFDNFQQGRRCMECSGNKKYTLKEVKKYFEDHDCELFETEYVDSKTKMKYRCDCGNKKCKITFSSFKQGHRCRECSNERSRKERQFSFKDVQQYFEDHDCKLLATEYINCMTPMEYECDCGNDECKITFDRFKRGSRCKKCADKKNGDKKRFKFEDVKQYFEDRDCELYETEYINNQTPMRYRCKCGNTKCKITFASFKRGCRCIECSGKEKHTFEFVYNYFKDRNCLLLETEYKNANTKMRYECNCTNESEITFNHFKNGKRCKKCAIERNSGKNHPNYNPNLTDEEREKGRICPGLGKWKKDVRERDNNTCQCCGKTEGKLCAHHIENYADNKELRIVVLNGILLCKNHHKKFHKEFGRRNNTREQLNEFLSSFAEIIKIDEKKRIIINI